MTRSTYLSATLILVGLVIIFLGLNVGLGGMQTLGWQTADPFIAIINESLFRAQDSHIRFIGGVWFGVGAVFVLGGFKLDIFRTTLIVLSLAIAVAGLFRLSDLSSGVIFSAAVLPSMVVELFAFPLLGWWLLRSGRRAV